MLEMKMASTPWGSVSIWPASGLHLDGLSAQTDVPWTARAVSGHRSAPKRIAGGGALMAQLCGPLDLQNDALASSDLLLDDAVLLERLDTRLERRRKTWFRSLLGAYVVVAGLILVFGWIYGAPDHLRLAIDRWWGGADLLTALLLLAGEASGNGNISFVDFMLGSMMPFLILPWITLIFGLTLYGKHKHGKRYQERVRLALSRRHLKNDATGTRLLWLPEFLTQAHLSCTCSRCPFLTLPLSPSPFSPWS